LAIVYHGENMKLPAVLLFTTAPWAQNWVLEISNTRASRRGISAVDAKTVWAGEPRGVRGKDLRRDGGEQ
jgi:hypothetical protein